MQAIIQEASVTGLFRFILIVLTVYWVFNLFVRFVFPHLMRKYVTNIQNQFSSENQRKQDEMNRKKEGEISITFVDKDKNTGPNPDAGDYVEYEEVK
jgi:hypothetical protein